MARFYIEETWRDGGVDVELYRVQALDPAHAAHLIEQRMLKPDDDQLVRMRIGQFTVEYPEGAFPKRVRRAALDWLAEHAEMTEADSVEIQLWTADARELLARLEAAVSG